jgi:hypothetical protein
MFLPARYYRDFGENVLPVRPYGLFVTVSAKIMRATSQENSSIGNLENISYEGFIEGRVAKGFWVRSPVKFTLPRPNKDGFFVVGSTLFTFVNVGFVSPWEPFSNGKYHFLDKNKVAIRVLEGMFGSKGVMVPAGDTNSNNYSPLANFFFQTNAFGIVHINNERLQSLLLSRLVTHPFVRQVQNSEVQIRGSKDMVLLYHRKDGIKIDPLKFPEEMLFRLDPCSTSSSETINSIYTLCDGARVERGQITKGISQFCEFTRRNTVLLDLSPSRACLARAAVMNSCELTYPQARPVQAEGSIVQTRNLLTAVMDLGPSTFEDTIAMSETCAIHMEAQSVTRITRWSPEPLVNLSVQKGDLVKPFGLLATRIKNIVVENSSEKIDSSVKEEEETRISLIASELKEEAILETIETIPAYYAGVLGVRTIFSLRSFLPMRTGDKITCFSGCKGVVIVLPNNEMPVIEGRIVDICVSHRSIFKRGTLGMLLEAAIGKEHEATGKQIIAMGDEHPLSFTWASMNHRRKSEAYFKCGLLPNKVFWGYVPWMRIVKSGISSRRLSAVGTDRPLTGEGLLPDIASTAGQSLDPSKAIVIISRGMPNTLRALLGDTPAGMQVLVETVAAIDGPAKNSIKNPDAR